MKAFDLRLIHTAYTSVGGSLIMIIVEMIQQPDFPLREEFFVNLTYCGGSLIADRDNDTNLNQNIGADNWTG